MLGKYLAAKDKHYFQMSSRVAQPPTIDSGRVYLHLKTTIDYST